MHTVVLAGGFGTRLQPELKDLPKPLAPVGDKCFLEFALDQLKGYGLVDFTLCLHYMSEKIMDYFGDGGKFGIKIDYSIEEKPMGTGGAIGLLRNQLNDTFCVINADTYLELDIGDCLAVHHQSKATATVATAYVDDISRFGRLKLDHEGLIKDFYEKDESMWGSGCINAGLYVFNPKIFDYIPENQYVSLEKDVFTALLQNKSKIKSYARVENFFDIGIPVEYFRFQQWVKTRKLRGLEG